MLNNINKDIEQKQMSKVDNLVTITLVKNYNKEDFLIFYNSLKCEILHIEKNNMDYKITIRDTKENINNVLNNEENKHSNLPF